MSRVSAARGLRPRTPSRLAIGTRSRRSRARRLRCAHDVWSSRLCEPPVAFRRLAGRQRQSTRPMSDGQTKSVALDIVAVGEPMIEFNQQDPDHPLDYRFGFGGDTSNFAVAAARQGARVAYITRIGGDPFGKALLNLWREEGVDVSGVTIDETASTGVYFVFHSPTGHSFTYLRAGSAASRMRPADVPIALIEQAKYLHVSGISQAISASACDS